MPKLKQQNEVCSVALALQLIGDRWTLLIIRDAFFGVTRFQDFHQSIGLARNVLSDRLAKLVDGGVLKTVPVGEGSWNEYQLTPMGRDLQPALLALMQWGDRWVNQPENIPVKIIDRRTGKLIPPIKILNAKYLAYKPGPGAKHPHAQRQNTVYERVRQRLKGVNP
ncbi:MAG: helix-turn-helix transcriptional regulator [Betaproteobacteria bacterium]|nr:helix-turn-helix transcriptional regulator [Betaproteobacteria bacterium]